MKKISILATGDSILTMRQSVHSEPKFLEMVERIRNVDLAFTNLEVLLHNYEGYPAAESGGTYMRADPYLIDEYKWMGFDVVSTANNHSLDYMYGGLLSTIKTLKEAGMPYAGTGENLAEAREPAYIETKGGRVALISAASSFPSHARAGPARRDMQGRPGLNPLRFTKKYMISKSSINALKRISEELKLKKSGNNGEKYEFLGNYFISSDNFRVKTTPNHEDFEGNLEAIRNAARQADWILFSLHCHEGREDNNFMPAEFIEEFARKSIDSGVHAFIGHGPHFMKGIEIRNKKPIFYSLGNFIYQNMTVKKVPAEFYERYGLEKHTGTPPDAYDARSKTHHAYSGPNAFERWISFYPYMLFEDDNLQELRLYPVELGSSLPRSQRGRPMPANKGQSRKIFQILKERSKPYGTEINVENGVGKVSL